MNKPCAQSAPDLLIKALDELNTSLWFECHETLESLWKSLPKDAPERDLYKGILMIAVGLYHNGRGHRLGALRKLPRAVELLAPFAPACQGVDVSKLLACCGRLLVFFANAAPSAPIPPQLLPDIPLPDPA
ncbi:DUF309 domain-containing protein [Desulfovibrio ferrophilus]|uniref:DUF309 domain-containing protein n=1 Tax=Desulfovibrio ferrophilus TaxID=241368 RepID=A0A2Z6AZW8_9BACT|nr:DUF309 domain-containing protein [Desulfovibrio ferrophilus]BBD08743.1 uncharacterized protein DFE_2017 [Desulfovibrio ferrophilus]